MTNRNKPMKIAHYLGYDANNPDFDAKLAQIKTYIDFLETLGYGGIVTNVSFERYLEDETAFALLDEAFAYCRSKGMRAWIYDEKGYPSGAAGGITLRDNPELEAKSVAGIFRIAAPGETVSISFPHGHIKVIAAFAYNGASFDDIDDAKGEDLTAMLDEKFCLVYKNTGDSTKFIAYFALKNCYENCHAEKNVFESKRYPDLMSKLAVRKFIENTYEKYRGKLKKSFASSTVEAFFTDEPSLMAYYLNNGLFPAVVDEPDRGIEMLPHINWTDGFETRFKDNCGYSILSNLVHVFGGDGKNAKKVRYDYHKMCERLYEEAFFIPLSDFCADCGMAFSGHILYEEAIRMNVIFEENFFTHLRHMQIPGIDILTTIPEHIMRGVQTVKLVASIADLYGRERVMSEVSSHIEGGKQTFGQMLGACMLQYTLGVNEFTSYYGEKALPADEYKLWNDTLGRTDSIMKNTAKRSKILLYYPIESAQMNYIPQHNDPAVKAQTALTEKKGIATETGFNDLACTLVRNQLDYTMIDRSLLEMFEYSEGYISAPCKEDEKSKESGVNNYEMPNKYEVLVIPPCELTPALEDIIIRCKDAGIPVFMLYDELYSAETKKLMKYENFKAIKNSREICMNICQQIEPDLLCKTDVPVAYMKRENRFKTLYLFTNTEDRQVSTEIELYGSAAKRSKFKLYDPKIEIEKEVEVKIEKNKISLKIEFENYSSIILIAE